MIYLKFCEINSVSRGYQSKIRTILKWVFEKLLPIANKDFDSKYDLVNVWLLEFEDEKNPPVREVGLNSNKEVIVIGPYEDNYGFWVDNNLIYSDFKKFEPQIISDKEFELFWDNFIK